MSTNNNKQLKPLSADDFPVVESIGDIPLVLLEAEGDLDQFAKELRAVVAAYPGLARVMEVMASRTERISKGLEACRITASACTLYKKG